MTYGAGVPGPGLGRHNNVMGAKLVSGISIHLSQQFILQRLDNTDRNKQPIKKTCTDTFPLKQSTHHLKNMNMDSTTTWSVDVFVTNKRSRKPKEQSRTNKPETLTTFGTQGTGRRQTTNNTTQKTKKKGKHLIGHPSYYSYRRVSILQDTHHITHIEG